MAQNKTKSLRETIEARIETSKSLMRIFQDNEFMRKSYQREIWALEDVLRDFDAAQAEAKQNKTA